MVVAKLALDQFDRTRQHLVHIKITRGGAADCGGGRKLVGCVTTFLQQEDIFIGHGKLGGQGVKARQLARVEGVSDVLSPGLIVALSLLGLFPLLARKLVAWARKARGVTVGER